ncbi:P22 phage major capsid protein family protein [Paludibaculum fermentans]|uniref:P22 phage major capsid protein family protein n=1 Tax=Paludibaculum fermentans TaxID=1473598 RepID=UPI003EB69DCF
MSAITSANLANAIVKLVAVDALPALSGQLVMGNLVNRDFSPTLAQAGDTVNVPIPPTMVANNIAEGGSVQSQNPDVANAQIVLNTHAEATFQIPDVTKVIAVPDLLRLYMQPAMIALAEKVESDLLNLYSQFTANTPLGTGGTALLEGVVDSAETALFNAKVPASEQKYLVVDGNAYSQLRQIARFSEYQTSGDAGLRALIDGSIGRIKDFYVFRSQFVKKTGTGPTTTNNIAFAKNALGLAIRRLPRPLPGTGAIAEYAELGNLGMRITMSYQPNTLAQQFTVDMLYGVGVLRNAHGVQVRS